MNVPQGGTYSEVFGPIVDSTGALVANAVSASDLSIVALVDSADADQSSGATLTYAGGGLYRITKSIGASAALGGWGVSLLWDNGTDPAQPIGGGFQVVTAAQADPLAASVAGYAIGTLGNKVSTLGVSTAIVSEHVNIDGDRIELVRGDAYLNADGLAKAWTVTGVSVASATISFDTFAGVSAFSKAMTVSGSTIYVDLTSANTSGLTKGTPVYRYEVVATLSGGGTSTLFSGDVWVTD